MKNRLHGFGITPSGRYVYGLAILAAAACGGSPGADQPNGSVEEIGTSSDHLYLDNSPNFTQNGNYIPMCWATPGYAAEKKVISEAIGRTWVAEANLHVTWREGCPTTGSEMLVKVQIGNHGQVPDGNGGMMWDHSTDGQSHWYGMSTLSAPSTAPLDLFNSAGITLWVEPNGGSLLWQSRMEYAAVHEFGHLLGFRHEQDRPETEARNCGGFYSGTTVGTYDLNSIMNYCGNHGNANGVLSPGDKSGIKQVYGARTGALPWGLNGDTPISADFDGDGKKDVAVYRSPGQWWIVDSSTHIERGLGWGDPGDIPVPGDYDGDGKDDICVWRPSTGGWYGIRSSDGGGFSSAWGVSGDIPVPGKYDGDAKTDVAVYRPSNGTWYVIRSSNGTSYSTAWGIAGDKVVPADYDGDSKTDIAVYRPSNGTWYIVRSSNGTNYSTTWGVSTDKTVPADYDGDGKSDVAIYRPSEGRWYIVNSSNGASYTVGWGDPTDIPMGGNYGGDNKADIVVWRPSTGYWYATGISL